MEWFRKKVFFVFFRKCCRSFDFLAPGRALQYQEFKYEVGLKLWTLEGSLEGENQLGKMMNSVWKEREMFGRKWKKLTVWLLVCVFWASVGYFNTRNEVNKSNYDTWPKIMNPLERYGDPLERSAHFLDFRSLRWTVEPSSGFQSRSTLYSNFIFFDYARNRAFRVFKFFTDQNGAPGTRPGFHLTYFRA